MGGHRRTLTPYPFRNTTDGFSTKTHVSIGLMRP